MIKIMTNFYNYFAIYPSNFVLLLVTLIAVMLRFASLIVELINQNPRKFNCTLNYIRLLI